MVGLHGNTLRDTSLNLIQYARMMRHEYVNADLTFMHASPCLPPVPTTVLVGK